MNNQIENIIKNRLNLFSISDWNIILTNSSRTFGEVIYSKKELRISKKIFSKLPKSILLETINHEIAHILAGENHPKHDRVWKKFCKLTSSTGDQFAQMSNKFYEIFSPKYLVKHKDNSITEYLIKPKPRSLISSDKLYLWENKKIRIEFFNQTT